MSDAVWQLLYPKHGGAWGTIDLTSMLVNEMGRGIPPLHYNVQRGTYQHGETAIGLRLDPRIIQIAIANEQRSRGHLYEELADLMRDLSPSRNWSASGVLTSCIYRKIMPGGTKKWRSDLVTTAGSKLVRSATGRFAEWGLGPGSPFQILSGGCAGDYVVESVTNENDLLMTVTMPATDSAGQYRVVTGNVIRDLNVLLEAGPTLEDDRGEDSLSANETIKLVAHDPVWRNPLRQSVTQGVANLDNLIFYELPNYPDRAVFPIWFGTDFIMASMFLTYLGTWQARPLIIVDGPFSGVNLTNQTTGDKLVMNYAAAVGEQVTINLETLSVTNNFGQNLMRYMSTPYASADSDLITFGLYPDPQVESGVNQVDLTVSGALLGKTSAVMYWYARYIGV